MFCTARTVLAVQLGPPTGAQSALLYTRNSPTCASTTVLAFWHRLQVVCAGTPARSALWQAIGWLHAWMHVYLNLINIPNISGGAADRIKNVLLGSFLSPTARQMVCRTQAAELTSAITETCRADTMCHQHPRFPRGPPP